MPQGSLLVEIDSVWMLMELLEGNAGVVNVTAPISSSPPPHPCCLSAPARWGKTPDQGMRLVVCNGMAASPQTALDYRVRFANMQRSNKSVARL